MVSTCFGFLFQQIAATIGTTQGADLATCCKQLLPKKVSYTLWLMAEVAIIGSDIQEVIGTAISLKILFGVELWIGILITIITTFLLLLIQIFKGMRALEIFFGSLIGVTAVCFWINFISIKPDIPQLIKGIFVPSMPAGTGSAAIALAGSILMPHNLYLHSRLVLTRNVDRKSPTKVKKALNYFRIETGASLFGAFLINMSLIGTFAHFQNKQSQVGLIDAGTTLQSLLGNVSKYIWACGLFAAGQTSTMSGTLAGQYVMEGFFDIKIEP
eukprot:TRINITY_DN2506_c0_g1_i2.p1 TRINITY_DN2506_c0_g1~~TRINITY_DN2506_c0_g1_i2.p1  ORF type:complete len:271 (+),score=45.18 TRINITY_DN2506_c0_g1_i2:109-921(+)